ncbi:hypothetical protein [Mangrovivirga cuniculi]|uniref:Uncharacterized protein n=1 Tax=Mangrovivirga cuniculi TaxID=2715131 RepID=A0A4D7KA02_9BACT|nr:hypothetical protein [Mangrovivirga cuniculi]QCK16168.1 hypothetical protein DCC35_16170 [Mangrovivirga cuniculi]
MNNKKVSISEPCHMKWNELDKIQKSKSRHCSECSIDIIDFTTMSNEEIIEYLSERKNKKVCGKLFSSNEHSKYSKVQMKVLNWHESIKSNFSNSYFKSVALALLGLMATATGCVQEIGEPAWPCREELVPDTTTVDPGDSTYVEICN